MAKSKQPYSRLWVVIARFSDGTWEPCDFADLPYVATNYHQAHRMKRAIYSHLKKYDWRMYQFVVVEAKCQKVSAT